MSVPGNINTAPPPSSFDNDADFYEESRWAKLRRRLVEEPLIPLGCALTCWALLEATKSMRSGDKHRTNRMFRRRIYAQGFTILAMVAGSAYWENDRSKRKQFDELSEEKRRKEKKEAWLRELEIRDQEEEELRRIRDKMAEGRRSGGGSAFGGGVSSVLEASEGRMEGRILGAARDLWFGRR